MKIYLICVAAFFLAFNVLIVRNGALTGGDTTRYTTGADTLLENGQISGKAKMYAGYIGFIAALKIFKPSGFNLDKAIVAIQIVVSLIALTCLYSIGKLLFSPTAGAIAASLFAINYNAFRWNGFILTESLFTSFIIITCYLLFKASNTPKFFFLLIPSLIFTIVLRPNGIFMAPIFLVYIALLFNRKVSAIIFTTLIITTSLMSPWLYEGLINAMDNEQIVKTIEGGRIFGGADRGWERLSMPKLDAKSGNGIKDLFLYATTYPKELASLIFSRSKAFFFLTREDYSFRHNLFCWALMPLLYGLFIGGVAYRIKSGMGKEHVLLLALVLAQTAVTIFTFVDHDHRYVSYIISFIFLYSAYGAEIFVRRIRGRCNEKVWAVTRQHF
ncbi:hypothetical protein MNBD_NITROSPINAE02-1156 [hydrothermal vent metagenome]|uniref:Glycosyltransferase RgtA/B/C/D-like domain-containing protein n=1 Tax=hydrothermal vent metagenome TaxID=652676 RepID=A0A3B1CB74_9ZZZZ